MHWGMATLLLPSHRSDPRAAPWRRAAIARTGRRGHPLPPVLGAPPRLPGLLVGERLPGAGAATWVARETAETAAGNGHLAGVVLVRMLPADRVRALQRVRARVGAASDNQPWPHAGASQHPAPLVWPRETGAVGLGRAPGAGTDRLGRAREDTLAQIRQQVGGPQGDQTGEWVAVVLPADPSVSLARIAAVSTGAAAGMSGSPQPHSHRVAATAGAGEPAGPTLERLLYDLASALLPLHRAGLGCGGVSAQSVLVRGTGQVTLDLTLTPAPPGSTTPASDVGAVADLAGWWAERRGQRTGALSRELSDLLDAASGPPAGRPGVTLLQSVAARDLASQDDQRRRRAAALGTQPAAAGGGLVADLHDDATRALIRALPGTPVRRPRRRNVVMMIVALLTVVAGIALGVTGGLVSAVVSRAPDGSVSPTPPVASARGWPEISPTIGLAQALTRRDEALRTGRIDLLARAVAPGSAAWSHDVALLAALRAGDVELAGLRTVIRAVPGSATQVLVQQLAHVRVQGPVTWSVPALAPQCRTYQSDASGRLMDWASCRG